MTELKSHSLYRKWRSQSFDDILGQDLIVRTLRNAIRNDRIAHAYLFTGPRGTGKTSTARVMAKAVNCLNPKDGLPCGECGMCHSIAENRSPDVIEIDGASTNGIDDVRVLRERAAYAPSEGRFKVYIIDEVHRLTPQAFDGLLKTLEEPPPHVLFVFASTEPHKVPATILSRCQRFDFHKIDRETTVARLREVGTAEGLSIDDAALRLIQQQSSGSLRDALGILDQVRAFAGDVITGEDVRSGIGLGRPEVIAALSEYIISGDAGSALGLVHDSVVAGIDPRTLSRQLIEYWRGLLLYAAGSPSAADLDPLLEEAAGRQAPQLNTAKVVDVLRALTEQVIEPRLSVSPELPLEIAIISAIASLDPSGDPRGGNPLTTDRSLVTPPATERAVRESSEPSPARVAPTVKSSADDNLARTVKSSTDDNLAPAVKSSTDDYPAPAMKSSADDTLSQADVGPEEAGSPSSTDSPAAPPPPASIPETITVEIGAAAGGSGVSAQLTDAWPAVIEAARVRSRRLQGLLRDAHLVSMAESEVTLGFRHSFHRDESDKPENRAATEQIIQEVAGLRLKVRCVKADIDAGIPETGEDGFVAEAERMLRGIHAQQFRSTKSDA